MTILIILILLILLVLGGSWYAYTRAFYAPDNKRVSPDTPLIGEQYVAVEDNITRISGIMRRYPYESNVHRSVFPAPHGDRQLFR